MARVQSQQLAPTIVHAGRGMEEILGLAERKHMESVGFVGEQKPGLLGRVRPIPLPACLSRAAVASLAFPNGLGRSSAPNHAALCLQL